MREPSNASTLSSDLCPSTSESLKCRLSSDEFRGSGCHGNADCCLADNSLCSCVSGEEERGEVVVSRAVEGCAVLTDSLWPTRFLEVSNEPPPPPPPSCLPSPLLSTTPCSSARTLSLPPPIAAAPRLPPFPPPTFSLSSNSLPWSDPISHSLSLTKLMIVLVACNSFS